MWNGSTWTDETAYFVSASGKHDMLQPIESYLSNKQMIQQMSLVLSNKSFRFSPHVPGSMLSSYAATGGAYHKKCRVSVKIDAGAWEPIFTGFVKAPKEDYNKNTVTFTVWDLGEILKKKLSTGVQVNKREDELIAYYLTQASLQDGADYISYSYAKNTLGNAALATIDYSTSIIPYSWLDDEDVWSELGDVAQASGARVFVDRKGRVCFWKGYRWATADTPEIIKLAHHRELAPIMDDKSFYDEVLIEYSNRGAGEPESVIWELPKPKLILPGATEEVEARFKQPAITVTPPVVNTHYWLRTLSGGDAAGYATVTPTMYGQNGKLVIANTSSVPVLLAKVELKGQPLIGQPAEQKKQKLGTPYHDRRLDVRANPYIQTSEQIAGLLSFLSWWYKEPKYMYDVSGLRGVPTREVGTRVTVEMYERIVSGRIISMSWSLSIVADGAYQYVQSFRFLDDSSMIADYFIVGADTSNSTAVLWH